MRRLPILLFIVVGVALLTLSLRPARLSPTADQLIETAITQAIKQKQLPGAVVLVGHRGRVIYRRAFGQRALEPKPEPMTVETIFDVSSLTKLVATATSVMLLAERGQLQLSDPLQKYLPEIKDPQAGKVSIERLLTHTSGYPDQLELKHDWKGRDGALAELVRTPVASGENAQFNYSDVNYIALGFLVERISGQSLAEFARANVFVPLGIEATTGFCPPEALRPSIAPTEWRGGVMLRGSVHGAQAERMGGVAGNGGLFTRADDLARYCQMVLDGGRPVLGPATLARMTAPVVVSRTGATRGLGWDIDSSLATSRGEFFPRGSFGHTGYAGVSLWIDPSSDTYVIFMSNMVHPRGQGDVRSLRARLFSIVAASLPDNDGRTWAECEQNYAARVSAGLAAFHPAAPVSPLTLPPPPAVRVLNGIDLFDLSTLKGRSVGLIGDAGVGSRAGLPTQEVLRKAPGVKQVSALVENRWQGLDTLVFDRQNWANTTAGLVAALELAAAHKLKLVVLDRPTMGGDAIEAPSSDTESGGLPVVHNLTMGELARLLNAERKLGVDLEVVAMQGWRHGLGFDQTGQTWIAPRPDLPDLTSVRLYPGLALLESTNLSVGQGTDRPYQWFGAPWLDGLQVAELLNRQEIPGVRFMAARLTPRSGLYAGQICDGVQILLADPGRVRALRVGLEVGAALARLYPKQWRWTGSNGPDALQRRMLNGRADPVLVEGSWQRGVEEFQRRSAPYLLYP